MGLLITLFTAIMVYFFVSMSTPPLHFFPRAYQSVIKFFAYHKTYSAFLFVGIIVLLGYGFFSKPIATKETYTVTLSPITQYVKVSGQVQASKDANLSFQSAGEVVFVGVKVGDKVPQGKVLATLSAGDAQAALLQAQASLSNMQAVLSQLQQGPRKEEVAIKEQTVENTKNSLNQAYASLPDSIQNVDAITADVIKNKFSSLFVFTTGRYVLSFSSCDQRLQGDIEQKRTALENTLAEFQSKSTTISTLSSNEMIDTTFEKAYTAAIKTNDLVNLLSNLLLSSCSISNPGLDGYRTTLSLVKSSMTALFSDITLKRSALNSSKNAYSQATRDLDLTKAGTDPYKIKSQTALVSQAEAQVAQARAGLSKTIISAPFAGVISKVDLSLGETASMGKAAISMIALDGFEVQAKVPEIDIVKVQVGAHVDVTLDAYGKDILFPAIVTRINPTATTEGTVPVYTVIVTFVGSDPRIKQGMTANVKIVTQSKSSVIALPARFIKVLTSTQGQVTLLVKAKEEVRTVTLGIRGADGSFEILSGLVTGDVVVPPTTLDRQAQKQTSN